MLLIVSRNVSCGIVRLSPFAGCRNTWNSVRAYSLDEQYKLKIYRRDSSIYRFASERVGKVFRAGFLRRSFLFYFYLQEVSVPSWGILNINGFIRIYSVIKREVFSL